MFCLVKIAEYEYKCSNKKNVVAEAKIELLDITYETNVIESQTNELDNTKRTLDRELTEMKVFNIMMMNYVISC